MAAKRDDWYSYTEARAVVQAMGIKSMSDYKARYRQDVRLSCTPHKRYAGAGWTNWYDFLGKESSKLYSAYSEAQAAAQVLGIKNATEYRVLHDQDPKLPWSPNEVYAGAGWTDWYEFLGKERPNLYPTYLEARAASQALGIQNLMDYRALHQQDTRLPSTPDRHYADAGWMSWGEFFGNERIDPYSIYDEAQAAAQSLGVKTMMDYRARYRQDPKLPREPQITFANNGWVDWSHYLGVEKHGGMLTNYPNMWGDVECWVKTQNNIAIKKMALRTFFTEFYQAQNYPDNSKYLLLRTNQFNIGAYQEFIELQAESLKKSTHTHVSTFFQWVLDQECTDADADERIVLPEYRNPFVTALAGFAESLQRYQPTQTTKIPLGYEYILRGRNFLVPNGEQVLRNRPSLMDLPHLQEFFDSYFDWIDVEESIIDHQDPNCIWRFIEGADRLIAGKRQRIDVYQIWSPVRFVALYTLLRFPLRGQQILWLDSGEADREIAVLDSTKDCICWEKNTGPLVGKGSKKSRPQAAVQRGMMDAPKIYVTTNKTGSGEFGYEADWIPDDLIYWFLLLRDWQTNYNPLSDPTKWTDISLLVETNEKILRARGTQCFLFRTDTSGQPLLRTTAFTQLLPALLYRIQRAGESLAVENINRKPSSPRFISPYTPHCLRVSLITAFIVDGDAPLHLISKLVGHASLVMTIYYTKLNSGQMRRAMGDAEKNAAQRALEQHAESVRAHGLHPLRSQLIATDGNRSLIEADVPNSACVVFDWGICPLSAAACHIGGEALTEGKAVHYAPVGAGYLGQKNCARCRFFVTGVPFLGGLVALANEIALEIHTESCRFQRYTEEVNRLEAEWFDTSQANQPFLSESERKQALANQQQCAGKLDSLLSDYASITHYVHGCLKLLKNNDQSQMHEDGVNLITGGDLQEVGVAFEESMTGYHLLAEICQNALIYKSANPSRAIPLIAQAIDRMAENNNLAPAMYRLTEQQKLRVAGELNELLLMRLGSWERIDDLISGDLMLLDIDAHEPELERITTQIQNLFSRNTTRQLIYEAPADE